MSTQIQTGCPSLFVAGDTVVFSINSQQYSSSLYTAQFILFASGVDPDIFQGVAQPDGSFLFTCTASETDTVLPEQYTATFVYTSISTPTTRKSIQANQVFVLPDPTKRTAPSPNQVLLTSLQNAQSALSGGTVMSATVNGQTWSKKSLKQLQDQIYVTETEVRREQESLLRLLGAPNPNIYHFEPGGDNYFPPYDSVSPFRNT